MKNKDERITVPIPIVTPENAMTVLREHIQDVVQLSGQVAVVEYRIAQLLKNNPALDRRQEGKNHAQS